MAVVFTWQTKPTHIIASAKLSSENTLSFRVDGLRNERTGLHGRLYIGLDTTCLAWSAMNIEKDEERTRISNKAHSLLSSPLQSLLPRDVLKHLLDNFCREVWPQMLELLAPRSVTGDDQGPLSFALEPYLLDEGGTILFGPPSSGKSYLALLMAVCIDAGQLPEQAIFTSVSMRKVLFINLERSEKSLRRRLYYVNKVLGWDDPSRPLLMANIRGRSLMEIKDALARFIEKENIQCLFLDSISRAGFGDLNENRPVNAIVDVLSSLCPTWFAIAHSPRQNADHIYGSIFFDAGADIIVKASGERKDQSTGVALEVIKGNDIKSYPAQVLALDFDDSGLAKVRTARNGEFIEISTKLKVGLEQEIIDYLQSVADAKASSDEIADVVGRHRSTIAKALKVSDTFVKAGRDGRKILWGVKQGF